MCHPTLGGARPVPGMEFAALLRCHLPARRDVQPPHHIQTAANKAAAPGDPGREGPIPHTRCSRSSIACFSTVAIQIRSRHRQARYHLRRSRLLSRR